MASCLKVSLGISTLVSVILIILGICVLLVTIPNKLEGKLQESLPPREGKESEDRFVKSPVATFVKFYFFNVINKDEVNTRGTDIKPKLQELGPYVYRQHKNKTISYWNTEEGYVVYNEYTSYSFEPEESVGAETDEVNHLNLVSVALGSIGFRSDGDLVDTHTVGELLFEGFSALKYFPEEGKAACGLLLPGCLFALYKKNNDVWSQEFVVSTGVKNLKDIGKVRKYMGSDELNFWYGKPCNELKGTDGKQFAPGVTKDDVLYVFSADVCRSFKFTYDKKEVVEQIDTLRFTIPPDVFADPNKNADNMCYCPRKSKQEECPSKAGVFTLDKCKPNQPIAMSAPHFYMGEQEYRDNFEGLSDDKEKHQTFLDIEPLTGTVISGAKRLQVNIILKPIKGVDALKNVKKSMYFPVMWLEEGARIDKNSATKFREKVTNPYNTGRWSMVATICIGAVVLFIVVVVACFKVIPVSPDKTADSYKYNTVTQDSKSIQEGTRDRFKSTRADEDNGIQL